MAIITISRQNGSLGDEIADALASRLGTTVISRKYALDNFFGEINPGTLDRLNESAKFFDMTLPGSDRTYADILVERIRALASESKDKDIVILGMGGSVLLSGFPGAIHVRVTASETTRLNTIAKKYRITADEANEVLDIGDRKHRKFVRTVYGKDITAPEQFDLILNTDRLSVDECVDAICELARKHDLRVKLAESNDDSKTIDHQTRNIAFKNIISNGSMNLRPSLSSGMLKAMSQWQSLLTSIFRSSTFISNLRRWTSVMLPRRTRRCAL